MYKLEDFKQRKFCDCCSNSQKMWVMEYKKCPKCGRTLPKKIWRD